MVSIRRVFLDTSAVFAGIWSAEGGGRALLKLGEARQLQLLVSKEVLTECEGALRKKLPEQLGNLALILDASGVQILGSPNEPARAKCRQVLNYENDVLVIAAAWEAKVDYFVTLDRQHFLDNAALHSAVPFAVGTPGDCIQWLRTALDAITPS